MKQCLILKINAISLFLRKRNIGNISVFLGKDFCFTDIGNTRHKKVALTNIQDLHLYI